jgi:WG containing repeat
MKSASKIITALLIAIAIIVFSYGNSLKSIASNYPAKISDYLKALIAPLADDMLFPIDSGYIDLTGKVVLKLPPNSYLSRRFSEGLAAVRMPHVSIPKEAGLGYIDRTGKIIIPPKNIDWEGLNGAENFSEGLAGFVSPVPDRQGRYLIGYMDISGREVIPAKYAKSGRFIDGIALVGLYTKKNELGTMRYAFINRKGKVLFENPKKFTAIDYSSFAEGLAPVAVNDKWGFINKNGKLVISAQFLNISQHTRFSEGLAPVRSANAYKYGYIDPTGKFQIKPKFDDARPFSEGLAAVKINDGEGSKWGYIDKSGKHVIPPEFLDALGGAGLFSEGLAAVNIPDAKSVNGLAGYIDRTGKFVIPPQFNQKIQDFDHGLAYVHTAFIDPNSRSESDPLEYSYSGGKQGYIDRTGKFVWEKIYRLN